MTTMRTGMLGRTLYYVLTGGLAIIFLFPLLWSLAASVSPQASTGQVNGFGLGNYITLFNYGAGLVQFLLNSAYVALLTVAITLAVSTLGGYAFARFRFPGREVLFLLTLSILMVPYATLLIPLYVLLNGLGLQNSLIGLSLVLAMFQLPFTTYMMPYLVRSGAARAGGIWTGGRLRHVRRPVANPPSLGAPRAHHNGPVRLPGGMERLLSSPHPANRQHKADPAARGGQPAAADDGRHRLRCHGGWRRGDGRPLPDPVPAAATSLRAWFLVRSRQGLTRRGAAACKNPRQEPGSSENARQAIPKTNSRHVPLSDITHEEDRDATEAVSRRHTKGSDKIVDLRSATGTCVADRHRGDYHF